MSEPVVSFANVRFRGLTRELLLHEDDEPKVICTVNAEYIVLANQDPTFCQFLSDNYSTFDGQVVYLLAKIMCPGRNFEKIAGSDFIYDICQYAQGSGKRVFLLGGHIDSNRKAVELLRARYKIEIEGFSPKHMPLPFEESVNQQIADRISTFRPHFVLVGFGAGKQEKWTRDNRDMLKRSGVKWAIGVGGTFEFVSGKIRRAPRLIQAIGLEGIFRLVVEPKVYRLKRVATCLKVFKYLLFPPEKATIQSSFGKRLSARVSSSPTKPR